MYNKSEKKGGDIDKCSSEKKRPIKIIGIFKRLN